VVFFSSKGDDIMPNKSGNKQNSTKYDKRMIHPVVIFPFRFRENSVKNFRSLLNLLKNLLKRRNGYLKPVFVVNNQTIDYARSDGFGKIFNDLLEEMKKVSGENNILKVWSVDTCQMWLAGLGHTIKKGTSNDVYWLIPGDFCYAEKEAKKSLKKLCELPKAICEDNFHLAIGEIQIDPDNAKQLIDTYGTYGLLYNWFPSEAVKIAEITRKPRTEFFAIVHQKLQALLEKRWFPYEQTVIILLYATQKNGWCVKRVMLEGLRDDPTSRENLQGAMEQIERCERAIKMHWREQHKSQPNWANEYQYLDSRSEEIRRAALTVLGQHLSK
jgi:hypothetical protein